jgi:hypothetical protein
LTVKFFDTRVAARVRNNAEEADRVAASKLSEEKGTVASSTEEGSDEAREGEDEESSDAVSEPCGGAAVLEAPPGLEELPLEPPPGLDLPMPEEEDLEAPPGLEHLGGKSLVDYGKDSMQDLAPYWGEDSSDYSSHWLHQWPSQDALVVARAQAVAMAEAFAGQWRSSPSTPPMNVSAAPWPGPLDVATVAGEASPKLPMQTKPQRISDMRLSQISLKDGKDKRTTLCLKPLTADMCREGVLQGVLQKNGLCAAVQKIKILQGRMKPVGFAIVKAASPAEVSTITRLFHGRLLGRSSLPISVSFISAGLSGTKIRAEPQRIIVASIYEAPTQGSLASIDGAASRSEDESTQDPSSSEACSQVDADEQLPIFASVN